MAEKKLSVPNYRLYLDGEEFPSELAATVEAVEFEEELNTAGMFSLKVATFDTARGASRFTDLETFKLGSEIKIAMGLDETTTLIVGEITSLEPTFGEGISFMEVRGFDRLHRLRFGTKQRTFLDVKDSDIATTIAGDWGLSGQVEDSGVKHPYVYQGNVSDLEFLLERAKKLRFETAVDDKTLIFRKSGEKEAPVATLEYRNDIVTMSFKLSPSYEGDTFAIQGWDVMKKEAIAATATTGKEVSNMDATKSGAELFKDAYKTATTTVTSENPLDKEHAEKLAEAVFNSRIVETLTGRGTLIGNPTIRAGKTVEITGIDRFSGIHYVTATTHTINKKGYATVFRTRRVGA